MLAAAIPIPSISHPPTSQPACQPTSQPTKPSFRPSLLRHVTFASIPSVNLHSHSVSQSINPLHSINPRLFNQSSVSQSASVSQSSLISQSTPISQQSVTHPLLFSPFLPHSCIPAFLHSCILSASPTCFRLTHATRTHALWSARFRADPPHYHRCYLYTTTPLPPPAPLAC